MPLQLPATADVWADVGNNEVQDHLRKPVGAGIRVGAVGVDAPNVHNTVHAVIHDNLLVHDRFALIVHAAFPLIDTDRQSDVDVALGQTIANGGRQFYDAVGCPGD